MDGNNKSLDILFKEEFKNLNDDKISIVDAIEFARKIAEMACGEQKENCLNAWITLPHDNTYAGDSKLAKAIREAPLPKFIQETFHDKLRNKLSIIKNCIQMMIDLKDNMSDDDIIGLDSLDDILVKDIYLANDAIEDIQDLLKNSNAN